MINVFKFRETQLSPSVTPCLDVVPAGAEEEEDDQGNDPDEEVLQRSEG